MLSKLLWLGGVGEARLGRQAGGRAGPNHVWPHRRVKALGVYSRNGGSSWKVLRRGEEKEAVVAVT